MRGLSLSPSGKDRAAVGMSFLPFKSHLSPPERNGVWGLSMCYVPGTVPGHVDAADSVPEEEGLGTTG